MSFFYRKTLFDEHQGPFGHLSEEDFNIVWECSPMHSPNGKVLDLACGSGALGNHLKTLFPGISIFGADISLNLLTWVSFPKCQADARDFPFRDNSFDCIVAGAAFHHFSRIERVISECSRCLKSDGFFLAYDPNKNHPQRLIMMTDPLRHIFYRSGDHAISPKHFEAILKNNGFNNIRYKYLVLKGTTPGFLTKLNHKVLLGFRNLKLNSPIPAIAPWFVISAIKT